MTYRQDIKQELIEKEILFSRNKESLAFIEHGFYITKELMLYLNKMGEISTHAHKLCDFMKLLGEKHNDPVRKRVIRGVYSYLPKGYYDIEKLNKYIMSRIKV